MFKRFGRNKKQEFIDRYDLENLELQDLLVLKTDLIISRDSEFRDQTSGDISKFTGAIYDNIKSISDNAVNKDLKEVEQNLEILQKFIKKRAEEQKVEFTKRRSIINLLKLLPEDTEITLAEISTITRYDEQEIQLVLEDILDKQTLGRLEDTDNGLLFVKSIKIDDYLDKALKKIAHFEAEIQRAVN